MTDIVFHPGKAPARPESVKLRMVDYIDTSVLPKPPGSFGHENLVPDWQMLGNDQHGDCVWAGAAHETMMWNYMGGHPDPFSEQSVLSDYSAVTGFNPNDPSTDQGTDMQQAASYRQKVGVLDANGVRHKVGAYLSLTPGNMSEHRLAMYLFGAVGIGIQFPASAMTQFNSGVWWSYNSKSPIEGGHYIPMVAARSGHFVVVTWGKTQNMTRAFFQHYNDESVVYLSPEMLNPQTGLSPEGFNLSALTADLKAIQSVH